MTVKYLYLDDEPSDITKVIAEVLQDENPALIIEVITPLTFENELVRLKKEWKGIDGIILDLRLDKVSNYGQKAGYRALALAQELRTRNTEGILPALPIVMCSTDDRLNLSYKKDETGHDLFDVKYLKDAMVEDSERVATELISLATGYKKITNLRSSRARVKLYQYFNLPENGLSLIDSRLLNYFAPDDAKMPVHEYARLIIKEMIEKPGVLINEKYLLTRLGIDSHTSADWPKLKSIVIKACSYTGPFCEGWNRYWMDILTNWWIKLPDCPGSLSNLTATERVGFLKKCFRLKNLFPIKPLSDQYGTRFWTVCSATDVPLENNDGFLINEKMPFPWQESNYISIDAALNRSGVAKGITLHPLEHIRFAQLKSEYKSRNSNA